MKQFDLTFISKLREKIANARKKDLWLKKHINDNHLKNDFEDEVTLISRMIKTSAQCSVRMSPMTYFRLCVLQSKHEFDMRKFITDKINEEYKRRMK